MSHLQHQLISCSPICRRCQEHRSRDHQLHAHLTKQVDLLLIPNLLETRTNPFVCRYLIKLDPNSSYFDAFQYPLGVARITVEDASGFAEEAKGAAKKLFSKITRSAPDTFAKASCSKQARDLAETDNISRLT